MTIEFLKYAYPILIVAGAVMVVILIYLRYLTNRAFKTMLAMVDANRECNYDVALFLPRARGLVKKVEIEDVFYDIHYGESSIARPDPTKKGMISAEISRSGYSIHLAILPVSPRGYQRYIYMIIFETLFLLIEMDILMKIKVANEALHNFSKLQTFLLHDVKNVTQFIKGILYNLDRIKSAEREHKFIEYLRESAPALAVRTDKILGTLEMGASGGDEGARQKIELSGLLRELFDLHGLRGEVTGYGVVFMEKHLAVTVFDNIVKNIREKSVNEPELACFAFIREEGESVTALLYDTGSPIKEIERMFEPFYTTKRSGLGIGLFQARHIVKNAGGSMAVANTDRGVQFTVTFPNPPLFPGPSEN